MRAKEFLYESDTQTAYHATPRDNLGSVLHKGLVPKKSKHYPSAGKRVYLFPSIDAANEALLDWLEDRFSNDILSLLKIDIRGLSVFEDFDELYTTDPISPDRISVIDEHWG